MPRLIQPEVRTETVVDAMNFILARLGPAGLTLRTISKESRVSTSSLLHHFGSRDHLLRVAAGWTGRARLEEIRRRSRREGVGAFLPGDDDEEDLITARAWLGWCTLWRCTESLTTTVADTRDREALLLGQVIDVPPGRTDLTGLIACVDGLTAAICAPVRPLAPSRARQILGTHAAEVAHEFAADRGSANLGGG